MGPAQRDAVPTGRAAEDLDAAVDELAVGRMRHRLGLDGGVDGHAPEVLRLGGAGALRGAERLGEQDLEAFGADALAPAGHGGAVERQGVLEVALGAEQLDVGAVEEAGADGVVGQAIHVLDQVQADHEARRQPRPADSLAIERAESGGPPRESRSSAAINRSTDLQGFRTPRTGPSHKRMLPPPQTPRKTAAFRVVHGRGRTHPSRRPHRIATTGLYADPAYPDSLSSPRAKKRSALTPRSGPVAYNSPVTRRGPRRGSAPDGLGSGHCPP